MALFFIFFTVRFCSLIFSFYLCPRNGGLAQLARALAWHARGHRFDPGILHQGDDFRVVAFFVSCTMRTGGRSSLPYQREVWRDCLYLLCAMHIAHRFDPGILHNATTFGLLLFFVSCTMRTGDRQSLPYQREVWRVCLYLVCAMHIAHRFDPGILHQGDNFRVVAFFCFLHTTNRWPIKPPLSKGGLEGLSISFVRNAHCAPVRPRYSPPLPSITSFGGGKSLNALLDGEFLPIFLALRVAFSTFVVSFWLGFLLFN